MFRKRHAGETRPRFAAVALLVASGCGATHTDESSLAELVAQSESLGAFNVLTRAYEERRTAANLFETTLTTSNVGYGRFGRLFTLPVDDQVYAQILYASAVRISGSSHNVIYVATVNNTLYTFDADSGALLWKRNFNGSGRPARMTDTPELSQCYNFTGNMGIVGTPVIDAGSLTIYFVTHTLSSGLQQYSLHAVDIASGSERSGSPIKIDASVNGTGAGADSAGKIKFDPVFANQRGALALSQGTVYVTFASYCDKGPYHGWVLAHDAASLSRVGVLNVTPGGTRGGIWMGGAAPALDSAGNLYVTTGNGTFEGSSNFGQSLLKLAPRSLQVLDYFTPSNFADLNSVDMDFGSAGPSFVPGTKLLVNGGKQGRIYVVNSASLGHSASGDLQIPQRFTGVDTAARPSGTHHIHNGVASWASSSGINLYVWGENDFLRAYRFDPSQNKFSTPAFAAGSVLPPLGMPGGMLSVSANGSRSGTGIVWATTQSSGDANNTTVPGVLSAFDAETLNLLWQSQSPGDDMTSLAKYNPPLVANGRVYVPSFSGRISVYGLRNGPSPPLPATTYQIRTGTGPGLCLDIAGGFTADAVPIQQYACNGTAAQSFKLVNLGNDVYEVHAAASGKCLDVSGGSAQGGAPVQQYTCNGSAAQRWEIVALGAGSYRLMPQTGASLCLDVPGAAATSGAKLQQWQCNGSLAQSFGFALDDTTSAPIPDGTYRIVTGTAANECIDALRSLGAAGTIRQFACNGSDAQRFRFTNLGSGAYEIRAAISERCLDVSGASAADGSVIQQYTCNTSAAQRWILSALGNGAYRLSPQTGTGRCLDVSGGSSQDDAALQQWACNGTAAQSFRIIGP